LNYSHTKQARAQIEPSPRTSASAQMQCTFRRSHHDIVNHGAETVPVLKERTQGKENCGKLFCNPY
jgi:hypothetical protein